MSLNLFHLLIDTLWSFFFFFMLHLIIQYAQYICSAGVIIFLPCYRALVCVWRTYELECVHACNVISCYMLHPSLVATADGHSCNNHHSSSSTYGRRHRNTTHTHTQNDNNFLGEMNTAATCDI